MLFHRYLQFNLLSLCLGADNSISSDEYEDIKDELVLFMFGLGSILYKLRTMGINKYKIWLPVIFSRIGYEFI